MAIAQLDLKAKDVMIHDVISVSPVSTVSELIELLKQQDITGVPVVEEGEIVGVVSVTDVVRYSAAHSPGNVVLEQKGTASDFCTLGEALQFDYMNGQYMDHINNVTVRDIMRPFQFSIHEDQAMSDVAKIMVDNKLHRLIVTDSNQKLRGIICAREIIKLFI